MTEDRGMMFYYRPRKRQAGLCFGGAGLLAVVGLFFPVGVLAGLLVVTAIALLLIVGPLLEQRLVVTPSGATKQGLGYRVEAGWDKLKLEDERLQLAGGQRKERWWRFLVVSFRAQRGDFAADLPGYDPAWPHGELAAAIQRYAPPNFMTEVER